MNGSETFGKLWDDLGYLVQHAGNCRTQWEANIQAVLAKYFSEALETLSIDEDLLKSYPDHKWWAAQKVARDIIDASESIVTEWVTTRES